MKEKRRLRLVIRKTFGPERYEVTVEWRKLHNEELNDLQYSTRYLVDKIKKNEMGGAYSTFGRQERCVQGLGGPKGKGPLRKRRLRCEDNIKIDL